MCCSQGRSEVLTPKTGKAKVSARKVALATAPDVRLFNRELSWLKFNERVIEEAANPHNPLLERLKFVSIFESNLDEFFMVRVSGLIDQKLGGILDASPDGLTPTEQIRAVLKVAKAHRAMVSRLIKKELLPKLEESGIHLRGVRKLSESQREALKAYFHREVFPLCTPLLLSPATTVPFISNRSLNLLVSLNGNGEEHRLARVKVPSVLPRLVKVPGTKRQFLLLEDLIELFLPTLFQGVEIVNSYRFRVIRDAEPEIKALEAADLIAYVEETLRQRRFGDPVMLEVQKEMPDDVRRRLAELLEVENSLVLGVSGIVGLDVFAEMGSIDRPSLKFRPFAPCLDETLATSGALFETVRKEDVLVHHPYDSFRSVEAFSRSAATDSNVIGIKQTLYRVGSESPIVEGLIEAAEGGKQVAAMVELKARFDETNNLAWAKRLEHAGAHVTYGFADTKTHCKVCLVVRREADGLRQYAHIGTGNYNPTTAKLYSDLGLFTVQTDIVQDISELFNDLTGFSRQHHYRKLLVAPTNLREGVLDLIKAEVEAHQQFGGGLIRIKVNSVVDPEAIEALYEASQAGVKVELIVRGTCCLRPGVRGLSENICVVSIVGRFLEHSRIYYFGNHGKPVVYIGSADLMRRNLDRRIEVLVPVESPALIERLKMILDTCLKDNVQAWDLNRDGQYVRRKAKPGSTFSAQGFFMDQARRREPDPEMA